MDRCIFSNLPIESFGPLDVAVIEFDQPSENQSSKCMCSMNLLISYLYVDLRHHQHQHQHQHQQQHEGTGTNQADNYSEILSGRTIETIYDIVSYALIFEKDDNDAISSWKEHYEIISFKFNKQSYHLSVLKDENGNSKEKDGSVLVQTIYDLKQSLYNLLNSSYACSIDTTYNMAQSRISTVLGLDLKHMKILHKGKVVYPKKKDGLSPKEMSTQLINLSKKLDRVEFSSNTTIITKKRNKNPSLVVIGTRSEDIFVDVVEREGALPFASGMYAIILKKWNGLSLQNKCLSITLASGVMYTLYTLLQRRKKLYVYDDDFFEL